MIEWKKREEWGCNYYPNKNGWRDIYEIPMYWWQPNYYATYDTLEEAKEVWENFS